VDKRSSNVAENQRVVILTGLVSNQPRIGAVRRSELILSNVGDPGRHHEDESLNGNDINCIDSVVAIHISSPLPAAYEGGYRSGPMLIPFDGDHIVDIDAGGARRQGSLGRCHGIAPAEGQTRERVITGSVSRGRTSGGTSQGHRHTRQRGGESDSSSR
jgi:hypothetical protein